MSDWYGTGSAFFAHVSVHLGIGLAVLTYCVIVDSSNAVNLTDGLDGLAIMPLVLVTGALAVFAYVESNGIFAAYLRMPFLPGEGEIAVFVPAWWGLVWAFYGLTPIPNKCLWGMLVTWHSVRHWAPLPQLCAKSWYCLL